MLSTKPEVGQQLHEGGFCLATLNGPDGWATGWAINSSSIPLRCQRQQGVDGVMFWAAIVNDALMEPARVYKGVELNPDE